MGIAWAGQAEQTKFIVVNQAATAEHQSLSWTEAITHFFHELLETQNPIVAVVLIIAIVVMFWIWRKGKK